MIFRFLLAFHGPQAVHLNQSFNGVVAAPDAQHVALHQGGRVYHRPFGGDL